MFQCFIETLKTLKHSYLYGKNFQVQTILACDWQCNSLFNNTALFTACRFESVLRISRLAINLLLKKRIPSLVHAF